MPPGSRPAARAAASSAAKIASSSCRALTPLARSTALRSHCRPNTSSMPPTTSRSASIGSTVRAGPRTATIAASASSAAATPASAERQPRATPAASTTVTASTPSTAHAPKTARNSKASRLTAPPALLQLAPAAGAVVGDDLAEHGLEGRRVDRLALPDRHGAGRLVVVAAGDDPLGVGDDPAVVEEHVDVVLGRQQGADVALQHEVRLDGPLDGLDDLRAGGSAELANLAADGLLPLGQGVDVGVYAWVGAGRPRLLSLPTDISRLLATPLIDATPVGMRLTRVGVELAPDPGAVAEVDAPAVGQSVDQP